MSVSSVIIEQINAIIRSLVPLNNPAAIANVNAMNELIGASANTIITCIEAINTGYTTAPDGNKTDNVAASINLIKNGLTILINTGVLNNANATTVNNQSAAIVARTTAVSLSIIHVDAHANAIPINPAVPVPVPAAAAAVANATAVGGGGAYANFQTCIRNYVACVYTYIDVLTTQLNLIVANEVAVAKAIEVAKVRTYLFPSLPLAPVDTIPNPANLSTKFYVVLLDETKAVKYVGHRIYNIANHTPITSFVHCRKNNVRDSVGVQLEILANYDGSRITDSATGIASPDNLKTWLLKYMTANNLIVAGKLDAGYLKDQDTFKAASAYTLDNTFTKPPADIILGGSKKNKRHRQIKSKSRKYKSKGGQADLNTIIANATNAIF